MIAAPRVARIDASLGNIVFARPSRVVHLGQSAIVLNLGNSVAQPTSLRPTLLTITNRAGGVTPGGLSISDSAQFARIRADFAAAGDGALIDLSRWAVDTVLEPLDLVLAPQELDAATILAVSTAIADEARLTPAAFSLFDGGLTGVRSRAADLANGALSLAPEPVLADIIGAGPGTTPTGDDMVVGCLAALAVLGRVDATSRLARATASLLQATTTTSRHYLAAAASGRFAEHVHNLIDGFSAGHPADQLLAHAHRWGATSGIDLLIGMTATLRENFAAQTEEGAA